MTDVKEDVLWAHGFGTMGDIKKICQRLNKFRKNGFYVEVDELTPYEKKNLQEACRDPGAMVGNIQSPEQYLICSEQTVFTKGKEIYHVRLYGPGPIRNKTMELPREYMVLQISDLDESTASRSVPMTLPEARRSVESCTTRKCMIVKIVEERDRIAEVKKEGLLRLSQLAVTLAENAAGVDAYRLSEIIGQMEKLCKQDSAH